MVRAVLKPPETLHIDNLNSFKSLDDKMNVREKIQPMTKVHVSKINVQSDNDLVGHVLFLRRFFV